MFKTIMIPIDLAHRDKLEKAIKIAGEIASIQDASLTLVGISADVPGEIAQTPALYREKLKDFTAEQSNRIGRALDWKAVFVPDPRRDLDDALRDTAHELGADLIVMASHIPTFADQIIASNTGALASHADLSVLIVR